MSYKFHYNVQVYVELTGREIALLVHCSQTHYDARCRQASMDDGFLVSMIHRCATYLPVTIPPCNWTTWDGKIELSTDLDLMLKILEQAKYLDVNKDEAWHKMYFDLNNRLRDAFRAMNAEFERLNPPPYGARP